MAITNWIILIAIIVIPIGIMVKEVIKGIIEYIKYYQSTEEKNQE